MNSDYEKFLNAFDKNRAAYLSSAYFSNKQVSCLTPESKALLTFLLSNGFCDGTPCYEMPAVALMFYRKEIVGESLDEFLQKVVRLGDLASCTCMNDESHLTKMWIAVPKIKQWMRRDDNPPSSKDIDYEIKSDNDLQAAFNCDEEQD